MCCTTQMIVCKIGLVLFEYEYIRVLLSSQCWPMWTKSSQDRVSVNCPLVERLYPAELMAEKLSRRPQNHAHSFFFIEFTQTGSDERANICCISGETVRKSQ